MASQVAENLFDPIRSPQIGRQTRFGSAYPLAPPTGQASKCTHPLTGAESQLPHQAGVAGAEAVAELGDEGLQVLAALLGGVNVAEELAQSVGQELVTEVVEGHQLVQDVPPARRHTQTRNTHPVWNQFAVFEFAPLDKFV